VIARYLPSNADSVLERTIESQLDLDALLAEAASHAGDRGMPAVELVNAGGSTLVIGQTRLGMVLLWATALGETFHSVSPSDDVGDVVVLDYFGSYTEVPSDFVVPSNLGRAAAIEFMRTGSPLAEGVTLEPD
jgi:hypothetical protein